MERKGFRRMLFGEKMPDKEDPQYKKRYEREVNAGRKFARIMRIDKAAAYVQRFANAHKTLFLVIVFSFVIGSFAWNLYRLAVVYHRKSLTLTATEMQDSLLKERHKRMNPPSVQLKRPNND